MHITPISRRHALVAAASALALPAASAPASAADKDNFVIVPGKSFGPIRKGATLAELERIYGKANIRVGMEQPPHGDFQKQRAAVIFPGTRDEAAAYLVDGGNRVERVVIQKAGGRWRTQEGLRIGTDLAALEKMLGGPFTISAYGQDGGGAIGQTKSALPRHLFIRVAPDEKKTLSAADEAAMNKNFRSNHPAARRAGLTVSVIWWDLTR